MTSDHQDHRDPLRAAFESHERAPRDIVPRAEHAGDDLQRLAADGAPVQVTHYEIGEHGITQHVEHLAITAPFTNDRKENR